MFSFFQNLFNRFRQRASQPQTVTMSFSNLSGRRISVAIDPTLPVQEQVNLLNKAAGDISWRVSPTGNAEYIRNAVGSCPYSSRRL